MADLGDELRALRTDFMAEIRGLRADLQAGYFTKDAGEALKEDIKDLQEAARAGLAFRRATTVTFLAAFIGGLFTLAVIFH